MKKRIIMKLLLIIIIHSYFPNIYSQMNKDLIKYWYYRNRLKYFVIPGQKIGESQIVCTRNLLASWIDPNPKNIDFGQIGKHHGLYIGTLATEYYLLKENGQDEDAAKTSEELYYSLYAVKTYWDSLAEPYWHNNDPSYADYNGFFIRGNVPCDFLDETDTFSTGNGFNINGESHLSLINKGLDSLDTWNGYPIYAFGNSTDGYLPQGHPGYADHRTSAYCGGNSTTTPSTPIYDYDFPANHNDTHPESMSQDEAIIILLGCALAAELGEDSVQTLAKDIADKIILKITNVTGYYGQHYFRIYEPDGQMLHNGSGDKNQGGNTYAYAPGLFETGYQITGDSYYRSQGLNSIIRLPQIVAWELAIRDLGKDQDLAASLLAMGNYARNRISWLTDNKKNWDTFYLLLWEVLNGKHLHPNNQENLIEKTLTQMDVAPCEGPFCYKEDTRYYHDGDSKNKIDSFATDGVYSSGGWASDYRWFKKEEDQDHGQWCTGNFNGLDYMLLYNLCHIMTKDTSPYYVNYNDKYLEGTVSSPMNFAGFNSITSVQTINSTSPTVNYVAGDNIHLTAGFHATAGSNFHAFINDIDCSGGYYPNSTTDYYDALISTQKEPYYTIEDDDTTSDMGITLPCPNDTIRFNGLYDDLEDDEANTYYWDFGNGDTSSLPNPKVFYDTPGNYTITLILTDTNGLADTTLLGVYLPNCNIYGTLSENSSCGGAGIESETLYITLDGDPVDYVDSAVTDENGYFIFNMDSTNWSYLDSTELYTINTESGIPIEGMTAQTIEDWIAGSSHSLHYTTGTVDTMWVRRYNGPDSLIDGTSAIDLQGNVYVTGATTSQSYGYDMLTIKYNPLGVQQWAATYRGASNGSNDIARAITVDDSCNVYVAGESYTSDARLFTVLSYSSGGSLRWAQTYYSTQASMKCISLDHAGNVIAAGTSPGTSSGTVFRIVKYDSTGNFVWGIDYLGDYSTPGNTLKALSVDNSNNIYVTGYSKNSNGDYDITTVKYNSSGTQQWVARYNKNSGTYNDYGYSNTIDSDGNIVVTGYTTLASSDEMVVLKYGPSSSSPIWTSLYNNDTHDFAMKALCNDDDEIYIGGYQGTSASSGLLAVKYDTDGDTIWSKHTLSSSKFIFKSATLDNADNFYLTGTIDTSGYTDIATQKLNANGDVQWTMGYNGTADSIDAPTDIVVSVNGNVYVSANSVGANTNYDFTTIKYSQCGSTDSLLKYNHNNSQNNIIPENENVLVERQDVSVKVIPNPNNGNMQIVYELPENTSGTFDLYNLFGTKMLSYPLVGGKNSFTISRSDLAPGIYFYRANDGSLQIANGKIIIIK